MLIGNILPSWDKTLVTGKPSPVVTIVFNTDMLKLNDRSFDGKVNERTRVGSSGGGLPWEMGVPVPVH